MEGIHAIQKPENKNISLAKDDINGRDLIPSYFSSCLLLIIVFILLHQFYKNLGKIKLFKKNKSGEDDDKEYLGFDDLPTVKLFDLSNFIRNFPKILPVTELEFFSTAQKWSEEFGDVFTISALGQRFVTFNSGPLIQTLMKSSDLGHVTKTPMVYGGMAPYIHNGVLVSRGNFWKHERKILMKSQSFQNLKAYIEMLNRHSGKLVQELERMFQDGQPHEIEKQITITFLRVISEMITGPNLDASHDVEEYHHNFSIWKQIWIKRLLNPILLLKPFWIFHPLSRENKRVTNLLWDFAKSRMKENRQARDIRAKLQVKGLEFEKPKFRSVLDELFDAGVEQKQIIDEIDTLMVGGHETGASLIHFLCFSLALNQDVQKKAREEVDELFDNPDYFQDGQITFDSVQTKLKYTERCVYEALRLFPPVFFMARLLESPLKFEYLGKTVLLPPGTNIIVNPFVLHRREVIFPNPNKFDPNRFLPENSVDRHAYSYIPFSAGPRNCLGFKFAMIELKILIAYIIRYFELETTDRMEDIPILPYTTLTPGKNFTFILKRRNV